MGFWLMVLVSSCTVLVISRVHGYVPRTEHSYGEPVNSLDLLDQYVEHVDKGSQQGGASLSVTSSRGTHFKTVHLNEEEFSNLRRPKRSLNSYEVDEIVDEGLSDDVGNVLVGDEVSWTHSVDLAEDGHARLSWIVDDKEVMFKVEASGRGYVGVGFSPRGDMEGADIVLGWVDDKSGKPYLVDCHGATKTGAPQVDSEQNYNLLGGGQNASHTVLRFSRSLDTCDKDNDIVLGSDTVRVIWALHRDDPTLDTNGNLRGLNWHGDKRGSRSLHLTNPSAMRSATSGPRVHHWDVQLVDFEVPDKMDTLYWCKIFRIPPLTKKHHMIGYEPILSSRNDGFVHHMILYECAFPLWDEKMYAKFASHRGASCYSPEMPREWDQCLTPLVAWAIGSEGEFLPEHVGLPLADGKRATYFMMEVHFDNPSFKRVKDNSGLRVHYTKDLRKYDGGILVNGIAVTPLHIIPPRQPEYRTAGYCNSQCTQKMLPQTGIKIISVVLHSHLAGKKLRLRHIRGGVELPRIAEDNHYDFNYQQSRVLPQEVLVKPGDQLISECVYQTPNRTEPTFGGYSTKQEMCLAFILYYPRTHLAACYSMTPVKHFFKSFGVREFYNTDMDAVERIFLKLGQTEAEHNAITTSTTTSIAPDFGHFSPANAMDPELNARAILKLKKMKDFTVEVDNSGGLFGELVIKEPSEFRNKSFMSHLFEHPWDEILLTQSIEASFYSGQHMVFCRKQDDTLAIPADIFNFPSFTPLPETRNNTKCHERLDHLQYLNTGSPLMSSLVLIYSTTALMTRLRQT